MMITFHYKLCDVYKYIHEVSKFTYMHMYIYVFIFQRRIEYFNTILIIVS